MELEHLLIVHPLAGIGSPENQESDRDYCSGKNTIPKNIVIHTSE
jgi:hypothetical protein